MSRIRSLKPEFFRSRSLANVSLGARLTFQGLWCEADDLGNGRADPRILKGAIWPLEDSVSWSDVDAHLDELVAVDAIRRYVVAGEPYFTIPNWMVHQSAAYRRGKGWHPEPPETLAASPVVHRASPVVQESAGAGSREQGAGSFEQGGGSGGRESAVAVERDTSEAERLCDLLADLITANGAKPRRSRTWVTDMDRLLRLDSRPVGEVETVIRWSQSDSFWRGNILCPSKLREKYDQLNLKRQANGRRQTANTQASLSTATAEFLARH